MAKISKNQWLVYFWLKIALLLVAPHIVIIIEVLQLCTTEQRCRKQKRRRPIKKEIADQNDWAVEWVSLISKTRPKRTKWKSREDLNRVSNEGSRQATSEDENHEGKNNRHKEENGASCFILYNGPNKLRRSGCLAGDRYIRDITFKVQQNTIFLEESRIFKYHADQFKAKLNDTKQLKDRKITNQEMIIVGTLHTYPWPIPFPIEKCQDFRMQKPLLGSTQSELNQLMYELSSLSLPNDNFFKIRVISLLAFTYIEEGKLGKALEIIEKEYVVVENLEPCEWTAWLHLSHAFLYLYWAAQTRNSECFNKSFSLFEIAMQHFLTDTNRGGSFSIGKTLILWCMFLIKSDALRIPASQRILKTEDMSIYTNLSMNWENHNLTGFQIKECLQLLDEFEREISMLKNIPHDLNQARKIIRKFKNASSQDVRHKENQQHLCGPNLTDVDKCNMDKPGQLTKYVPDDIDQCHDMLLEQLAMGRKIPQFIQGTRVLKKKKKIVINVDKNQYSKALDFLTEKAKHIYESKKIIIVKQSTSQFVGNEKDGRDCQIFSLTDEEVCQSKEKQAKYVGEIPSKCGFEPVYGSFGGMLFDKDKPGNIYGSTTRHSLDRTTDDHHTERCDEVKTNICTADLTPISNSYFGNFEAKRNHNGTMEGVDIALFPLDPNTSASAIENLFVKNKKGDNVNLTVAKNIDKQAKNIVKKYGAKTGETIGQIIEMDSTVNIAGKLCKGAFVVRSVHSKKCEFALPGDSGSWVVDHLLNETDGKLYGVVVKKQDDYILILDDDDDSDNVHGDENVYNDLIECPGVENLLDLQMQQFHAAFCLNMETQLNSVKSTWGLNLDIYNPSADSGYTSLDLGSETHTETEATT